MGKLLYHDRQGKRVEHPRKVVRCTLEELHFDGKREVLSWFGIQISNLQKTLKDKL